MFAPRRAVWTVTLKSGLCDDWVAVVRLMFDTIFQIILSQVLKEILMPWRLPDNMLGLVHVGPDVGPTLPRPILLSVLFMPDNQPLLK